MAIYYLDMKNVSRGKGSSSVCRASYILRTKMHDDRLGHTYYAHNSIDDLAYSETLLPHGASERYRDPEVLFNEVELHEKAINARVAKSFIMAIPREFDLNTACTVVRSFAENNFVEKGYAVTYAIHDKNDGNPHVHVLAPTRQIDSEGNWVAHKSHTEYILVQDEKELTTSEEHETKSHWEKKRIYNEIDTKQFIYDVRASWAEECNKYLGTDNAIDSRSYEDRCIDRIPTYHEGYFARDIEKAGGVSRICEENRKIEEMNAEIEAIQQMMQRDLEEIEKLYEEKKKAEKIKNEENIEYQSLGELIQAAKEYVDRTDIFDVFLGKELPECFGNEELENLRDEFNKHTDYSMTPEAKKRLDSLAKHEHRMKTIIKAVAIGMGRGESDEDLEKRVKMALEGGRSGLIYNEDYREHER